MSSHGGKEGRSAMHDLNICVYYCTRIVGIDSVEGTSPVHVPTEPTCNQDEGKPACQQYVNSMYTAHW